MIIRRLGFTCFFVLLLVSAAAQQISVKSFESLPHDQTARITQPVMDQNGEKCALIKVVTHQRGFVWEGGMLGISKIQKKTGEYWVYVPHGAEKITIKHDQLGVLRDYRYPVEIEKARVYEMVLTTGKVHTVVESPEVRSAYLVLQTDPDSVDVYIDNTYRGRSPFRGKLEQGSHTYRLEKHLYHSKAGKFELSAESGRKELSFSLEPHFGRLQVNNTPESGMRIYLDGSYTGRRTPATLHRIESGQHRVTLRDQWYQPKSTHVQVRDRKTSRVNLSLKPVYGEVFVRSSPAAAIYIDQKEVGHGTYKGRLREGIHSFSARKAKYASASTERKIVTGHDYTLNLNLEPKYGHLDVKSEPPGARISVGGKDYGRTPRMIHDLLVGEYRVKVDKPGYFSRQLVVTIDEGETTAREVALDDKRQVRLSSDPEGARLYIEGVEQGRTPLRVDLSNRRVDITLRKEGYRNAHHTLRLDKGKESFRFEMERLKIYSGYNLEAEWGPAWGFELGFFGGRFFLSGSVGTLSKFKFDKEVDVQDVRVNDIDQYEPAGYKAFPDKASEDENKNTYFAAKIGYQLTWPFPFFIHAGYGVRYTHYYKEIYRATHDYIATDDYSPILEKGDYFSTPDYHADVYNSPIVGVDVPIFDSLVMGADYWFNTEVGPTFNFSLGFMFREIKNE